MKLRQIEFALAIARLESFSRAADACGATQPTLSSALTQLEDDLGGKLFDRTTRKVALTGFGRHMLPYLEAVLDSVGEVRGEAEAFRNPRQKILRIGFSPLVDMKMIQTVTAGFSAQQPDTEIFYKECLLDDMAQRLASGGIDVVALPRDIVPDDVDRCPFYADPLHYIPRHGTGGPTAPLRFADVPEDPVIMTEGGCGLNRSLEVLATREGAVLHRYPGFAMSYPVIQEWAWMGLGAGILPRAKLDSDNLSAVSLLDRTGQPAVFEFFWCWRRDARLVSHVADFLEHLRRAGSPVPREVSKPRAV